MGKKRVSFLSREEGTHNHRMGEGQFLPVQSTQGQGLGGKLITESEGRLWSGNAYNRHRGSMRGISGRENILTPACKAAAVPQHPGPV